jgi:hypothetical protein
VQSPRCVLTRRSKNVVSWARCSAGPATEAPYPSSPRRRYRQHRRRPPEAAAPALGGRSSSRTPAVYRVTKTQVRRRGGRLRVSLADRTSPSTVVTLQWTARTDCRGNARFHTRTGILRVRRLCQKHCTCRIRTCDRDISPRDLRRNANADELIIGIIIGASTRSRDLRSRKSARGTLRNRVALSRTCAGLATLASNVWMVKWSAKRLSNEPPGGVKGAR